MFDIINLGEDSTFGDCIKDIPTPSKKHACPQCGKAYKYRKDVQRHEKSCHGNLRPYRCTTEGCKYFAEVFPRNDGLKRHAKTHVAEDDWKAYCHVLCEYEIDVIDVSSDLCLMIYGYDPQRRPIPPSQCSSSVASMSQP